MKKKTLNASLVLAILISSLAVTQLVDLANTNPIAPASYPRITINSDGSITPPTAPINRTGNVYTLTEDILEQTIMIYRSDIMFEGAGHIINVPKKSEGNTIYETIGIWLLPDEDADGVINRKNVLIRNLTVFGTIEIYCGDNCQIEKVTATNIWIEGNSNTIKDSACGLGLSSNARNNLITQNSINYVWIGSDCYSNKFYLNNFNLADYPGVLSTFFWDNGDIGNFWSNYTTKYPNAIELGNSGIGNTQYTIEKEYYASQLERQFGGGLTNVTFLSIGYVTLVDRFPLMYPWGAPHVTLLNLENLTLASTEQFSLNFSINKPTAWTGYSLDGGENITVGGNATLNGLTIGSHNITVYAKDTSGNIGASETYKFEVAPESTLAEASESILPLMVVAGVLFGLAFGLIVNKKRHKPIP